MRIENEQQNEARMEIHFPHLTNGIAPVRPTRRHRARTFRKLAISSAIALAAVVGVIGASSANAKIIQGVEASDIIASGELLYVEREPQRYTKFVYSIAYFGRIYHCVSISNSTTAKVEVECIDMFF